MKHDSELQSYCDNHHMILLVAHACDIIGYVI